MGAVLVWWLALDVIALSALPLAWRLLRALPDRGLALARVVGLALMTYAFWLSTTLGFTRNTRMAVIAAVALVGIASAVLVRRELERFWNDIRARAGIWLVEEILFAVALCAFCAFRAYNPEIAATEKPMEFGFLNGILRSPTFPPADPWLAGYAISYYYMGYVMMAALTRVTGLVSAVCFNLMGATLFALTIVGSFSLVYNLVAADSGGERSAAGGPGTLWSVLAGALGALFVAALGNLEGVLEMVRMRGWGSQRLWQWLDVKGLQATPPQKGWIPADNGWWWRASRVIHDRDPLTGASLEVIDEFPAFSFLLGDNHPHVLALPFVLLSLAIAFAVLRGAAEKATEARGSVRKERGLGLPWDVPQWMFAGLLVGALGFLNTWDYPLGLAGVAVAFAIWRWRQKAMPARWLGDALLYGVGLLVVGIVCYLPFYLGFRSQAGGLGWVGEIKTRWHQYGLMFGVFLVPLGGWLGTLVGRWSHRHREGRRLPPLASLALAVLGGLALGSALRGWWVATVALSLAGVSLALALWGARAPDAAVGDGAILALLMAAAGLLLTASVEFVFLRDSFGTRMNTVFKFYYQGWVLLGLAAAYGVWDVGCRARRGGRLARFTGLAWLGLVACLTLSGLAYTVPAVISKADGFRGPATLDGVAYLRGWRPAEYEAFQWLRTNARPGDVMLEAAGGSYTEYNWVSAYSGVPTVLGWGGHELQWRGNYDEPGRREPHIALVYQSTDRAATLTVLDAYSIDYVYLGPLERAKYHPSQPALAKLDGLLFRVFANDVVTIYARRRF